MKRGQKNLQNYKNLGSIKVLFLVSGILNLLTAISWALLTVLGTISTIILGCGGFIVTVIVTAACIFDFISYNRLNKMNRTGTSRLIKIAAVLDLMVILSLNVTSVVLGVIVLVKMNNIETQQELKQSGIE